MRIVIRIRHLFPAVVGLVALACGGGHGSSPGSDDAEGLSDECRQYLAAYGTCIASLSAPRPEVAAERVELARQSLLLVSDHAQLKKVCTDGTAQLRVSCP